MSSVLLPNDQNAVADLASMIDVNPDAIVTKALYESAGVRLVLFAMDAGQRLTDHSASKLAFVQMIDGQIEFDLEGETHPLLPGSWVAMQPGAVHAVRAIEPSRFLLTLIKEGSP